MEENDFFVMLNHPRCAPLIMNKGGEDDCDFNVAYFETYELAKAAAQDNDLGSAFGYEVFQLGCGE